MICSSKLHNVTTGTEKTPELNKAVALSTKSGISFARNSPGRLGQVRNRGQRYHPGVLFREGVRIIDTKLVVDSPSARSVVSPSVYEVENNSN